MGQGEYSQGVVGEGREGMKVEAICEDEVSGGLRLKVVGARVEDGDFEFEGACRVMAGDDTAERVENLWGAGYKRCLEEWEEWKLGGRVKVEANERSCVT